MMIRWQASNSISLTLFRWVYNVFLSTSCNASATAILVLILSPPSHQVNSAREEEIQANIDELEAKIRDLEDQKRVASQSLDGLTNELARLHREREAIDREILDLCGDRDVATVLKLLEEEVVSSRSALEDGPMSLFDAHQAPLLLHPWPSPHISSSRNTEALQALTPSQMTVYSNAVEMLKVVSSSLASSSHQLMSAQGNDEAMRELEDDVELPPPQTAAASIAPKGEVLGPLVFLGEITSPRPLF